MKNEYTEHYKLQISKAQKYLFRYIEELKMHFGINDTHIIKILEEEVKNLKNKYKPQKWFKFWQ